MSDLTIPGIGPVKKPVVFAVGGGAALLAYVYYRRRGAATSADTSTQATPADTSSDTVSGDYGTGYDTGQGYAVVPTGNVGSAAYSPYGYDVYGNPLPAPTQAGTGGGVYTDNASWATAAETDLENSGYTLATASLAISRVLGGLTVTSDQAGIFHQAVGLVGQPPQGYPQPIKLSDTPGQPGTTAKLTAPTHLKVTASSRSYLGVHWDTVSGAQGYHVDVNGGRYASVSYGTVAIYNLKPNTHYTVKVTPFSGSTNGPSASVAATTKK